MTGGPAVRILWMADPQVVSANVDMGRVLRRVRRSWPSPEIRFTLVNYDAVLAAAPTSVEDDFEWPTDSSPRVSPDALIPDIDLCLILIDGDAPASEVCIQLTASAGGRHIPVTVVATSALSEEARASLPSTAEAIISVVAADEDLHDWEGLMQRAVTKYGINLERGLSGQGHAITAGSSPHAPKRVVRRPRIG